MHTNEHLFRIKQDLKRFKEANTPFGCKLGGVIGIDDITVIIIAIMGLIVSIVEAVQSAQGQQKYEEEEKGRDQVAKKAERDQEFYKLQMQLKEFNETLGSFAKSANTSIMRPLSRETQGSWF